MRCLTCHYSLKNLPSGGEHRCPECGRRFDPRDPASYKVRVSGLPWLGVLWITLACYAFNAAFLVFIWIMQYINVDAAFMFMIPFIALFGLPVTLAPVVATYAIFWMRRDRLTSDR